LRKALPLIALSMFAVAAASAQSTTHPVNDEKKTTMHTAGEMGFFAQAEINWKDGPGSLPLGAKFAVLEGDPAKEGPFVMRVRMPDGYRIPPHWHPKVERITVISGSFNLGMGEKFDQSATREMAAGTFGFWPAGMRHFVWTKGETVIQLHGIGPWVITYVNPTDDPRGAKK
jgi:quercetin dioxygenase-like cupin family protein